MDNPTRKNNDLVAIEVVYAKPDEQAVVSLDVVQGSTVEQAIGLSGLRERFPEIDQYELRTGVFGVLCKPGQAVKKGDRIEIYRPLIHDPKDARRQRALKK